MEEKKKLMLLRNLKILISKNLIFLFLKRNKNMRLFIRTLIGKTIIVEVNPNGNFLDLKEKIRDKVGIPVLIQAIIFAGKEMKNTDNIEFLYRESQPLLLIRNNNLKELYQKELEKYKNNFLDTEIGTDFSNNIKINRYNIPYSNALFFLVNG